MAVADPRTERAFATAGAALFLTGIGAAALTVWVANVPLHRAFRWEVPAYLGDVGGVLVVRGVVRSRANDWR